MEYAKSFKELQVYKVSRTLASDIFYLSKTFPSEEKFSLTEQIRRSSRLIGAQIADSWAKRRCENLFVNKLSDADSEQYKSQHWIEIAFENNYISEQTMLDLLSQCRAIGKMLSAMIDKAPQFCKKRTSNLNTQNEF